MRKCYVQLQTRNLQSLWNKVPLAFIVSSLAMQYPTMNTTFCTLCDVSLFKKFLLVYQPLAACYLENDLSCTSLDIQSASLSGQNTIIKSGNGIDGV
jgi:hypothetical protein